MMCSFFSSSFCIGMVDTIFADVAQPDQARILALNAHHFLKNTGHFVISIKVNGKRFFILNMLGFVLPVGQLH